MPRTCFVIMPFSKTDLCTEEEWTYIFENIFKPAIEGAGLDYECRRSEATRGNMVAGIIRELNDAYIVLADLTDRNANVFYELGVRHALKNRSIILAQRRGDIPFDLSAYASHVYDWKTDKGKANLTDKIRQLLAEIDTNPDRSDNPVSDFLEVSSQTPSDAATDLNAPDISPQEVSFAQSLVGTGAEGLNSVALTRRLAQSRQPRAARTVYRLTRPELIREMRTVMDELNKRESPGSIQAKEIPSIAQEFISAGEPIIVRVEEFALTAVEEDWREGVGESIRFAGDLITLSERPSPGTSIRFAQGLPALLAWRLLILMGAKSLTEEGFASLKMILNDPIEVEELGDRFSHRSFVERLDLFHPEGFLGHADLAIKYLIELWRIPHLQQFFESEEHYHLQMAQFLIVVALADAMTESKRYPLYPGYKLFPEVRRAMAVFCGRLAKIREFRDSVAKAALGENGSALQQQWSAIVSRANSAELGSDYWPGFGVKFPDPMDGDIPFH